MTTLRFYKYDSQSFTTDYQGSCIQDVFDDAQKYFKQIQVEGHALLCEALARLSTKKLATQSVWVFNPIDVNYSGVVLVLTDAMSAVQKQAATQISAKYGDFVVGSCNLCSLVGCLVVWLFGGHWVAGQITRLCFSKTFPA
jgi:hypothetical protein